MRIHDRYILRAFWRNLALGLISFTAIFIIVDVSEKIDRFVDNNAAVMEIVTFYLYQLPWIIVLVMPVAVLLSCVFSLGKLSRDNELTAFIASGTSLLRVAAPIIVTAFVISIFINVFGESVVPITRRRSERIWLVDIEERAEHDSHKIKSNLNYQGENNRMYYAERYDVRLRHLLKVVIQEYDGASLIKRIDAKKGFWDGDKWVFLNGAVREFSGGQESVTPFDRLPLTDIPERPDDFAKEEIEPEEMNYLELREYIDKVRRGGGPVDKYRVDLYFKFSFPFTNLIFAVIGIALSSAKRKPSMATGFGLTLLISFTYYGILRIGQALGHSGVIGPLLAAWIGNILFVAVGGVLLYRANQ